jgi:hypothetical protein
MELVKMKDSTQLLGTARSFIAALRMRREATPNMTLHVEKEQSGIRIIMSVIMTGLCREVTVVVEVLEVGNKQEAVQNKAYQDKLNKGVHREGEACRDKGVLQMKAGFQEREVDQAKGMCKDKGVLWEKAACQDKVVLWEKAVSQGKATLDRDVKTRTPGNKDHQKHHRPEMVSKALVGNNQLRHNFHLQMGRIITNLQLTRQEVAQDNLSRLQQQQ